MFLRLDAGGQQQLNALSKQLEAGREAIAKAEGADDGGGGAMGSLKAEERKVIMEFYVASAEAKAMLHPLPSLHRLAAPSFIQLLARKRAASPCPCSLQCQMQCTTLLQA